MATLTAAELSDAVAVLVTHRGIARVRDRLAQLGAFTSRRGLNTPEAIAERLYRLSGGLRLQVPATYAFSSVWAEMMRERLGEEGEHKLEGLAEAVNACLTGDDAVAPGQDEPLERALDAYREVIAAAAGADVARLDMLMKAVPAVADRLRAGARPPVATDSSPPEGADRGES